MKRILLLAVVLALGGGPVLAAECSAVALRDVAAIENARFITDRGSSKVGITQYREKRAISVAWVRVLRTG
jgi:hypothetical protein